MRVTMYGYGLPLVVVLVPILIVFTKARQSFGSTHMNCGV